MEPHYACSYSWWWEKVCNTSLEIRKQFFQAFVTYSTVLFVCFTFFRRICIIFRPFFGLVGTYAPIILTDTLLTETRRSCRSRSFVLLGFIVVVFDWIHMTLLGEELQLFEGWVNLSLEFRILPICLLVLNLWITFEDTTFPHQLVAIALGMKHGSSFIYWT